MRLESDFSSAVTFLTVAGPADASGVAQALPVGTAFLIGEPLGDTGKRAPWLITARHAPDAVRLSAGPDHPVVTLPRAILIEATTWPASSGAPVFVHRPRRFDIDDVEGQVTLESFPTRLMGLCAGHYAVPAAMSRADGEATIGLNSGVSVVTPAAAILELMRVRSILPGASRKSHGC